MKKQYNSLKRKRSIDDKKSEKNKQKKKQKKTVTKKRSKVNKKKHSGTDSNSIGSFESVDESDNDAKSFYRSVLHQLSDEENVNEPSTSNVDADFTGASHEGSNVKKRGNFS
ncbi:jg17701 [Pararge aegeria aegeria]|uniref:Jg17701 protein n=1 Tax=Pararge aegeria aegeria TaxID=348720 RepID=A0A8S4QWG5_9NEOP|nr:jg17701 [Pararge aegeria aegeria]